MSGPYEEYHGFFDEQNRQIEAEYNRQAEEEYNHVMEDEYNKAMEEEHFHELEMKKGEDMIHPTDVKCDFCGERHSQGHTEECRDGLFMEREALLHECNELKSELEKREALGRSKGIREAIDFMQKGSNDLVRQLMDRASIGPILGVGYGKKTS